MQSWAGEIWYQRVRLELLAASLVRWQVLRCDFCPQALLAAFASILRPLAIPRATHRSVSYEHEGCDGRTNLSKKGRRRCRKTGEAQALTYEQNASILKSGTAWLDPAESPEPVKEALPADPQASFS